MGEEQQLSLDLDGCNVDVKFYYEKEDLSVGFVASVSDVELTMDLDKQSEENRDYIFQTIHEEMEKLIARGKHG